MADVINKRRRPTKLNLNRLKEQMAVLNQDKTMNIEKVSRLEAMLNNYRELKYKFENDTDELISNLDENADDYTSKTNNYMKEVREISEVAFHNEAIIKTLHMKLSMDEPRQSLIPPACDLNASFRASSCQPKLEKIAVPTFDGNILNFPNFKGLFENLIHNNAELLNVQKLYYLKQAMVGKAKELVRDFKLIDNAYGEAWDYLLSRFDNKRALIKTLFRNLYNLEAIKNESQIRALLDDVELIIRGLTAAEQSIDGTFSRFITFIVGNKLDSRTAKDWENSLISNDSYPMFEELQRFLQIRAFNTEDRSIESVNSLRATKSSKPTGTFTEKRSFVTNSGKVKCIACQENHFLNQCKTFGSKSVLDRFEIVKKNKLCLKCFNPFHTVAQCKRLNCRHCNGNHHSMLHRDTSTTPSSAISVSLIRVKRRLHQL